MRNKTQLHFSLLDKNTIRKTYCFIIKPERHSKELKKMNY